MPIKPSSDAFPPSFHAGGMGIISSASEYLRIGQMLLNGGELDGAVILKPETVNEMLTNQLAPELLPYHLGSWAMWGFGLGVQLTTSREVSLSRPSDEVSWGGLGSTSWFISHEKDTVLIIMSAHIPINGGMTNAVKPAFYGAIEEEESEKIRRRLRRRG